MAEGYLPPALFYKEFEAISTSISAGWTVPWRQDLPWMAGLAALILYGPLTDNAPIDVIHWSAEGDMGESGLEIWQQCLTLFMRHI
jgi:hypothetical protein